MLSDESDERILSDPPWVVEIDGIKFATPEAVVLLLKAVSEERDELREALEGQLEKHKHRMHAPVTDDKETWCACFGCELARTALDA